MKTKVLAIFLFLCVSLPMLCTPPDEGDKKIVLSYLDLNDTAIEFVAFDIHSMILRKKKGYLWPAVKVALFKEKDELKFIVTAIDNSWSNMFVADETPRGYFTVNGRLFIVTTKGDDFPEFDKIFSLDASVPEKIFYKAEDGAKPVAKNPVWTYLHRGEEMATVLNSVHIENLGR